MEPFWVVSSEVFFGKFKILYQNKITLLTNTHKLTFVEGFVGYAVAQLVEALRYKPEGRGFNSRWSHWNFSVAKYFRKYCRPGVDSASNRNEYQESFLGVKTAGA
jgi:hypothetical protein